MGGPLVVRTAAAVPGRVGAGASFHGGGLVSDAPTSPHLLAPKIKARMYFAIASNDDMRQPNAKDKLREAFTAAKVPAEIEVYPGALHGWCMSDMPHAANAPAIYSKPDAERAWGKLVALYKAASPDSGIWSSGHRVIGALRHRVIGALRFAMTQCPNDSMTQFTA